LTKLKPNRKLLYHEKKARKAGYHLIAGVDEAGRGPLAGPVVAASVVLKDLKVKFKNRIDDSKVLSPKARLKAYDEIRRKAFFGVGIIGEKKIDSLNIYKATILTMEKAVKGLGIKPDLLLIDGNLKLKIPCKKVNICGGDSKSLSIACASIIAKVTRDRIMEKYHKAYPHYGFKYHKGYGTKRHFEAISKYGPSPIHRMTFRPIKQDFPGMRRVF